MLPQSTVPAREQPIPASAYERQAKLLAYIQTNQRISVPQIVEASGFVRGWQRGVQDGAQHIRFEFSGYTEPFFRLAGAERCRVAIDGKAVQGVRERGTLRIDTTPVPDPNNAKQSVEITCAA